MTWNADGDAKRVAILQPNYIPWKGYFDMIASVDEFILYDDAQYTKNDWRNRNRIKTPSGVQWITIPVRHNLGDRICDVRVSQSNWNVKHWKTLSNAYARAPKFHEAKQMFCDLYGSIDSPYLCEINMIFITAINRFLGIDTTISQASDFQYFGNKSEKVLSLCKEVGADVYLSGPSARAYLDTDLFRQEGIQVEWMDYSGYREYPQLFPPFEHSVSIVDLIFHVGDAANTYLKSSKAVC